MCAGMRPNTTSVDSYYTDTCTSQSDATRCLYLWWSFQNALGDPLPPSLQQEHKVPVQVDKDILVPCQLYQRASCLVGPNAAKVVCRVEGRTVSPALRKCHSQCFTVQPSCSGTQASEPTWSMQTGGAGPEGMCMRGFRLLGLLMEHCLCLGGGRRGRRKR